MNLDFSSIDRFTAQRILAFLNGMRTASDLIHSITERGEIQDNPESGSAGSGYTIGETVAARLISVRNKLRSRRFSSIDQLDEVEGFGQDKLNDLAYSFRDSAEDKFVKSLYSGIILDNWTVQHSSEQFESEEEFLKMVNNNTVFENWVIDQVKEASRERFNDRHRSLLSGELVRNRYVERYEEAHLGSYSWALWFYRIDQDNWFSFDRIREVIEKYLGTYESVSENIEVHFFKGYPNWAGLTKGITPRDLVVTLNHAELRASVWSAELFD